VKQSQPEGCYGANRAIEVKRHAQHPGLGGTAGESLPPGKQTLLLHFLLVQLLLVTKAGYTTALCRLVTAVKQQDGTETWGRKGGVWHTQLWAEGRK